MPTNVGDLDVMRGHVLDRLERHARNVRYAIFGAAAIEAALIAFALLKVNFSDRFEVVVFVLFLLTYTVVCLGLLALGSHMSRIGDRVLAALQALAER